jgi:hypothetical protein
MCAIGLLLYDFQGPDVDEGDHAFRCEKWVLPPPRYAPLPTPYTQQHGEHTEYAEYSQHN